MKRILILSVIVFAAFSVKAQVTITPVKPYEKNKALQDFNLLNIDSVAFTSKDLPAGKDIIVMLFNPDCDHCQKQLDEILSVGDVARKAEVLMISVVSLKFNREFYKKNRLEKYSYIHLGQDVSGFCVKFFEPRTIPVLAFYNKKREFVSINYGNINKDVIEKSLVD